ncbi:MAG: 30S ribosomal protein S1 [Chloroflexia bacterium]|nr:30S ribosomal protein S1 [Chloroflexia bacterium]
MNGNLGLEQDMPSMADLFKKTADRQQLRRGDLRWGQVLSLSKKGALVQLQHGEQGLVPTNDLERLPAEEREAIQTETQVLVYVTGVDLKQEKVHLSIYLARKERDWIEAEELLQEERLWEGLVSGYNKGGLIVHFGHIRGFVPTSEVSGFARNRPHEQQLSYLAQFVDQKVPLKVIEVDRRRRRLIFSEAQGRVSNQENLREKALERLQKGRLYRGRVQGVTDYGVFVDLGGVVGLIHHSELAWFRVEHPCEIASKGQELEVKVIRINRERERISLSLKQTYPDPWPTVTEGYELKQLVEGQIIRKTGAGLFLMLDDGTLGFVSKNDVEQSGYSEEQLALGQRALARLIRIDGTRRRLGLSLRRVRKSEREDWLNRQAPPPAKSEPAATENVETQVPASSLADLPEQEEE